MGLAVVVVAPVREAVEVLAVEALLWARETIRERRRESARNVITVCWDCEFDPLIAQKLPQNSTFCLKYPFFTTWREQDRTTVDFTDLMKTIHLNFHII